MVLTSGGVFQEANDFLLLHLRGEVRFLLRFLAGFLAGFLAVDDHARLGCNDRLTSVGPDGVVLVVPGRVELLDEGFTGLVELRGRVRGAADRGGVEGTTHVVVLLSGQIVDHACREQVDEVAFVLDRIVRVRVGGLVGGRGDLSEQVERLIYRDLALGVLPDWFSDV